MSFEKYRPTLEEVGLAEAHVAADPKLQELTEERERIMAMQMTDPEFQADQHIEQQYLDQADEIIESNFAALPEFPAEVPQDVMLALGIEVNGEKIANMSNSEYGNYHERKTETQSYWSGLRANHGGEYFLPELPWEEYREYLQKKLMGAAAHLEGAPEDDASQFQQIFNSLHAAFESAFDRASKYSNLCNEVRKGRVQSESLSADNQKGIAYFTLIHTMLYFLTYYHELGPEGLRYYIADDIKSGKWPTKAEG